MAALDNTMGALLLGVIFAMGFWGTGCVQLYYYINNYPNDNPLLKSFAAFIWALDTVHQGLIIKIIYSYLVTDFGQPDLLFHIDPCLWGMLILSGFVCFFVQCFLSHRCWILSKKNIFVIVGLMSLVCGELASIFVYLSIGLRFTTFEALPHLENTNKIINALSLGSDLSIAAVLIFYLYRARTQTGFRSTETFLNRLIIFFVSTGALTGACSIMSFLLNLLYPLTFTYIAFFVCISRLYTNTLFATLNSRPSQTGGAMSRSNGPTSSNGRLPARYVAASGRRFDDLENGTQMVSIKVDTELHTDADSGSFGDADRKGAAF